MFTWQFSEKIATKALPHKIWALWEDVSNWPKWDKSLLESSLNGDFITGASAVLKPIKGPKIHFTLIDVKKNEAFVTETKLPLGKLLFKHKIAQINGQSFIIHEVNISGFSTPLFSKVIGNDIKKNMKQTMLNLSLLASK